MDRLFTETFFKKNDYFRNELGLSGDRLKEIKSLISNWQKNCRTFTKGIDKETGDANQFIEVVFEKILGYHGKGKDSLNYTLTSEFAVKGGGAGGGSGSADMALGYFTKEAEKAQVLVEFKDQSSDDLDKPSSRKDRYSPVDQCWNYLEYYTEAKWGIVTNFNEIRLYFKQAGKARCETFYFNVPDDQTLRHRPLSEETETLKFINILKAEHLLARDGKSYSEDILSRQGLEEQKVQKEFYSHYKELRSKIFSELLKNNREFDNNKHQLLSLVQKFLDRIIFCWFCEDSRNLLLPSNILSRVIEDEKKSAYYSGNDFTIWEKVKNLFRAIDRGGNFDIPHGYDGGLFKEDTNLDALKIRNFLFEEISGIGRQYDFGDENELNVNILGHIFEQSISDLEEMRSSFEKSEETAGKKGTPSKRKKEGVYYTPEYITRYIVENTVGAWLKEKLDELDKKYSPKDKLKNREEIILTDYRENYLKKIRILDPACGSGAFLIAAFNYLWKEHQRVHNEMKKLHEKGETVLFKPEEIDKSILQNNLYGVDINSESVEITKLSLWLKTAHKGKKLDNLDNNIKCGNSLIDDPAVAGEKAFKWEKEFPEGGFDVVIGNPPYIPIESMNNNEKDYYKNKFIFLERKYDSSIVFILKGLELLHEFGNLGYISSITWQTGENYLNLRKYLLSNHQLKKIINLPFNVFEDAYVDTGIYVIGKTKTRDYYEIYQYPKNKDINTLEKINYETIELNFINREDYKIILQKNVNIILAKTKNSKFISFGEITDSTQGLAGNMFHVTNEKGLNIYPYLVKGQVYRYSIAIEDINHTDMGSYKSIIKYYIKNERILIRRIISRQNRIMACYYNQDLIVKKDLNPFIIKDENYHIFYLLALINSKLLSFLYLNQSTIATKDDFRQTTLSELRKLPIFKANKSQQKPYVEKANSLIEMHKRLHSIINRFLQRLRDNFRSIKITQNLEDFYTMDFAAFLDELRKQKIRLSLKDQDEWKEYFEEHRKETAGLKAEIEKTDRQIDRMVYELYGLTEEEIAIVEGRDK